MEEGKERMISMAGTIGFHALIILFLLFVYLTPSLEIQKAEDFGGVPVMFGNVPDAGGDDEPFGRGDGTPGESTTSGVNVSETPAVMKGSQPAKSTTANDRTITSNVEETAAIKARNDEKARQEAEAAEKRRAQQEADRIAQEQAQKKNQIGSQMSGLFGNGSGSGSRGNTSGTGTQGVPTGNASFGETSGVGGWGGSFNLGGRSLGSGGLIRPKYTANDYGTVVVDIVVDSKGNVVEATIGKGTNTTSSVLKDEALSAAKRTKFNAVSSVVNQKGTITYKFNLN